MKINVLVGNKVHEYKDETNNKILIDVEYENLIIRRQYKDIARELVRLYPRGSWKKLYIS